MAVSSKGNALLSRLKLFLPLQKLKHSLGENRGGDQIYAQVGSDSAMEKVAGLGQTDMSKWRKLDSRTLGIARNSIPESSWIVLKILQRAGFEAYLVGGCVRDLLLNKAPKDFDIITTAALKQIKKEFHRCIIVGSRFPICRVHVKGTVIEVSSFDTVAKHDEEKDLVMKIPHGCDKNDFVRWKNSMHRDFTVNSLFFNPFEYKIYDYANAMMDLRSLKLRTLIPALQSFKEDNARILRGLRLSARLGLSLSKETEVAIRRLIPSIASLPKARIMMEMNYMLSYGASGPSIYLLEKYKLLEMLLPLHAAYLDQLAQNGQSFVMLMDLFCNLDKLVTCDQPSDCNLWVGLLAFHLALVLNPQDALVLWTFASVLYHGNWAEGVKFGREHAHKPSVYIPEITEAHYSTSNDELAEKVAQLASAVQYCIGGLSDPDTLTKLMARFPNSPCSGMIFVPKGTHKRASDIFKVLSHDLQSYEKERKCFDINFTLLGKGDLFETRFVLGKIILDTLNNKAEERHETIKSDPEKTIKVSGNEKRKRGLPPHITEPQKSAKKKKLNLVKCDSEEESTQESNKYVDTKPEKAAKPKLKVIEREKEVILHLLKTVKDDKYLEIKNEERQNHKTKLKSMKKNEKRVIYSEQNFEERQEPSETKLEPEKKNTKKVIHLAEKTNLALDKNKKREKVPENNGAVKGKTEKLNEEAKECKRPSLSSLFRR